MRIPRYDLLTENDLHILLARLDREKVKYSNYWDEEGRANRARVHAIEWELIQKYYVHAYPNANKRKEESQGAVHAAQTPTIQPTTQGNVQDAMYS